MEPGQIQITRDDGTSLLLHHGTVYRVNEFEPFDRGVRADQGGTVPWGDGGWSGAEWRAGATIPIKLGIHTASWSELMAAWWALDAAMAPVRTGGDVEVTWNAAGTEYLMYTRPRGARLQNQRARTGIGFVSGSFYCPDPSIYSAVEHVVEMGLLHRIGGASTPFGAPFGIRGVVADGEAELTNAGTTAASLRMRITGPVTAPRVAVITGQVVRTLRLDTVLGEDDYLDIDTGTKLVLLNSVTSRLPDQWDDWPLLPPGDSIVRFEADEYESAAGIAIRYRDTY